MEGHEIGLMKRYHFNKEFYVLPSSTLSQSAQLHTPLDFLNFLLPVPDQYLGHCIGSEQLGVLFSVAPKCDRYGFLVVWRKSGMQGVESWGQRYWFSWGSSCKHNTDLLSPWRIYCISKQLVIYTSTDMELHYHSFGDV